MTVHELGHSKLHGSVAHETLTRAKGSCCCQSPRLTPRQVEVLCVIASGASTDAAAIELCMSSHTLAHHLADMLRLSESRNRTELVARAYAAGILEAACWPPRGTGRYCLRMPASGGLIDPPQIAIHGIPQLSHGPDDGNASPATKRR
jgi:DNA-binding CsgD family transcriptional regulator